MQPPPAQDRGSGRTKSSTSPLSTSHWSVRRELVAAVECFWQLWRQWEMSASGSTETPCHSLPSPLPPCSCCLHCRVHWCRMLWLAHWSSVRHRLQALGAVPVTDDLRGSCWISCFLSDCQYTHRDSGNVSQDGDSLRSYPAMFSCSLCHHLPLIRTDRMLHAVCTRQSQSFIHLWLSPYQAGIRLL